MLCHTANLVQIPSKYRTNIADTKTFELRAYRASISLIPIPRLVSMLSILDQTLLVNNTDHSRVRTEYYLY